VELLALAGGGAAPGEEDLLWCCGLFVVLPAVVLLALVAVVSDATWAGWAALAVAGLPYLAAQAVVAGYQPTADWEVADEQALGRRLVGRYVWLVAVAGLPLVVVWLRRAVRWATSRSRRGTLG
jgi:hypothetical protein